MVLTGIFHLIAAKHVDRLGGKLVRQAWVSDCWREKRRLDERLYFALPKHYLDDAEDSEDEDEDSVSDHQIESESVEEAAGASSKPKKGTTMTTTTSSAVRELPSIFDGLSFYFYGYKKKKNDFPESDKVSCFFFLFFFCIFSPVFTTQREQYPTQDELARYAIAFGADVCEVVTEEITHLISWAQRGVSDVELAELASDASPAVKVVTPQWLWDSVNTETHRSEQPYLVPLTSP